MSAVDLLVLNWMNDMERHLLDQQRLALQWEIIQASFEDQISEMMKGKLEEWSDWMIKVNDGVAPNFMKDEEE